MVNEQQINILGIVAGLFNAAPGEQFLTEFTDAVDAGLTETQLASILAAHPVFTNDIMGDKNTTSSQVAVLMNHYGLVADGVADSAASQAEVFFTNSIDSDVGFDTMVLQAGVFLLGDSVPDEFTETANLFKNKITVAGVYSTDNSSTDLATLQNTLAGLSGETVMTPEDATTFLQNGGIIPNPNAVTLDEAIDGPLAGPIELKDVSDTFTINIISADDSEGKGGAFDVGGNILVTLEDPAGTTADGDAETFTLNATINDDNNDTIADGINAQTITVAGVENLVISSAVASTDGSTPDTDAAAHTLTVNFIADDAETITITGDSGVDLSPADAETITITGDSGVDLSPAAIATIGKVSTVDASGSTGNVRLDFGGHDQSVVYTGSDGIDSYWGSLGGGTILAGTGHDFLHLEGAQAAQDILVLEAITDSIISDTNNDGQITILEDRGFDEAENFKVGAASTDDRLDVSFLEFTGIQQGIVDVSAKVPAFDTDLTSIPDLFSDTGGDRGLAFSVIALPPENPFPPQSFVFIDANKDGDFTAADDMLVELQGAGPLSEEAIFIF